MSQAECYACMSLVTWVLILFFLLTRFTDGVEVFGQTLGLTVVEQSAGRLLWTYVTLTVVAIIAEGAIAAVLAVLSRGNGIEKDERDAAIDARANLASYWFTATALNVIVLQVLANAAYGRAGLPVLNLTSLTGIAFALLFVLVMAEIVKRIVTIWSYRVT